ncbi:uncharacterized protein LOC135709203 [Ochlerotatus camptorhynchus]|uniref:uncharacterized protein LOC135709203 n=1 Tax=Ochlerotatus camptorhynchus TaxID=644619 RepID=UPI0031E313BF
MAQQGYLKGGTLGSRHGTDYQVHVLMWLYERAATTGRSNYADFRLASEMEAAGKFDDAVLSWQDGALKNWLFVQVKHKVCETLVQRLLLPTTEAKKGDGDFSLYKYLLSFWDIERNEKFAGRKQYVIFTNCELGMTVLEWFEDCEKDVDGILKIPGGESRLLKMKFNDRFCDKLVEYGSRAFNELVDALKAIFIDGRTDVKTDVLRKYRGAIASKILVVDKTLVKFTPRFIKKKNLDPLELQLRKNLFRDDVTLQELISYVVTDSQLSADLTIKDNSLSTLPPAIDRKDVKLFFNRLIFAINQPNNAALEKIIYQELMARYNSPMQDPDSRESCTTLWYTKLQKMVNVWLDRKEGTYLERHELETELQAALHTFNCSKLDVRTEIFQGKMQNLRLEFTNVSLSLSQVPLAIISNSQQGLLTSLKLYQILKGSQYRYFTFEDLQISSVLGTLLDVLRKESSPIYLLLKDNHPTFNFHTKLFKGKSYTQIILLTYSKDRASSFFNGVPFTTVMDSDSNLTHLSKQSQHILKRRAVLFQGHERTLMKLPGYNSAKDLFKNDDLEKLIRVETLTLGPELVKLETKRYIPRIISNCDPDEWGEDSIASDPGTSATPKAGQCVNYTEEEFLADIPAVFARSKIVILSSTPGMGKSTLWSRLALLAKKLDPSRWVMVVKLQDCVDLLTTGSSMENLNDCMELLGSIVPFKSSLDRTLFYKCLQVIPESVYLLFDGFDELPHEVTDRAIDMLRTLCDHARVFVNTRIHHQQELEKALGVKAHFLKPMSSSDQKELFLSSIEVDRSSSALAKFLQNLTQKIQSKSLELASKFFGVPLIIKMLAEIYKINIELHCKTDDRRYLDSIDLDSLSILQLYNRFVYSSFRQLNVEKLKLIETNRYVQQILAPESYFYKGFEKLHCFLGLLSVVREQQFGGDAEQLSELHQQALCLDSPIVTKYIQQQSYFIHASIGEFFAAKSLVEKLIGMTLDQVTESFAKNRNSREVPKKRGTKDVWDLYYLVLRDYPSVRKFFFLMIQQHPSCLGKLEQLFWCMRPYPLLWACEENVEPIARMLIEEDPAIAAYSTKLKQTPLHCVAVLDADRICTLLLDNGADPKAMNLYKQSALHIAALNGSINVATLLIDHGASVDTTDQNLYTPLHLASQAGHVQFVKLLLNNHCQLNLQTKKKWNALHIAAFNNHAEIAMILITQNIQLKVGAAKQWLTFLGHIVARGFKEVVSILVEYEVRTCSDYNETLNWAIRSDRVEILRALHKSGVNVHDKGDTYRLALRQKKHHIAQELLRLRSPADTLDQPLHAAAEAGSIDCLEILLVDTIAEVNAVDKNGMTPLDLALKFCHPNAIELLLGRSAIAKSTSPLHTVVKSPICIKVLLRHGISVDATNNTGSTALHLAALQKNYQSSWLLLQKGASPLAKGNDGRTVLHVAAAQNFIGLVPILVRNPALVEQGIAEQYVNEQDKRGQTALHLACEKGFIEVVSLLLASGARVDGLNNRKEAPIHLAASGGHWDVVRLLLEQKADIAAVDGQGMSHLDRAVAEGHLEYVRNFLGQSPPVSKAGIDLMKAIKLAKERGHLLVAGELATHLVQ